MGAQSLDYQFDEVEVKSQAHAVLRAGKPLALEPKAFRVLLYLIENRDRAIGKDELIEKVWEGAAVTDNALSRIVAQLRKELGDDARQPRYIQTLPTLGYRFVAELAPAATLLPVVAVPHGRRWMPAVAAGMALVAMGAAAARWFPHNSASAGDLPTAPRAVQITTSPGLDLNGSFNPDDSEMVYSSNRSGHFELYLHPVNARGRDRQITFDEDENLDPAWSPDGSSIAFYSVRRRGIWVVPATGGEVRQVSNFGSQPVWSPDSQRIAFAAGSALGGLLPAIRRGSEIWVAGADGGGLRRAIQADTDGGEIHSFCWWPDGKRLLVTYRDHLYMGDTASGKLEILAEVAANGHAAPAPDGKSVYYINDNRIFRLPLSGERKPVQLFDGDTTAPSLLAVSRAGNRLTFTRLATHSELWRTEPGTEPQPVFRDVNVRVLSPRFSPDGSKLAFLTSRIGSHWEIWVANPDGSGAFAVASAAGLTSTGWNADGSAVLYFANRTEIRRVTPGGADELLLKSAVPLGSGQVTPDERSVIYMESGKSNSLWKLTFGGQPRRLTSEQESAGFASLSRDGKWIVCDVKRGVGDYATVMDIDGGPRQELTPEGGTDFPYSFSDDDRRIAVATRQNDVWNIATIDRVTKERKVLTHYSDFGNYVRYPAWRPHSEQMVYERTMAMGNIYVIDVAGK